MQIKNNEILFEGSAGMMSVVYSGHTDSNGDLTVPNLDGVCLVVVGIANNVAGLIAIAFPTWNASPRIGIIFQNSGNDTISGSCASAVMTLNIHSSANEVVKILRLI